MMRVTQFSYFVNPFQGANSTYTLNFGVKTTLTNSEPSARRQTLYFPSNPTVLYINLKRSFINSDPPLHIAKTLLHEAFHAKLLQKVYEAFGTYEINNNWVKKPEYMELNELLDVIEEKSAGTNLLNVMHQYMAANMSVLVDGLIQFAMDNDSNYKNYDIYDYQALAREGLRKTTSLYDSRLPQMLGNTNVDCNN